MNGRVDECRGVIPNQSEVVWPAFDLNGRWAMMSVLEGASAGSNASSHDVAVWSHSHSSSGGFRSNPEDEQGSEYVYEECREC